MSHINLGFLITVMIFLAAAGLSLFSFFNTDVIRLFYISLLFALFLVSAIFVQKKLFASLSSVFKEKSRYLNALTWLTYESTICMAMWVPFTFASSVFDGKLDGIVWLDSILTINAYIGYLLVLVMALPLGYSLMKGTRAGLPPSARSDFISFFIYLILLSSPILLIFSLNGGGTGMIGW